MILCVGEETIYCMSQCSKKLSVYQMAYSSEYYMCDCCRVNVLYLHVSVPPLGPISMIQ